jgi:hypothetical protein
MDFPLSSALRLLRWAVHGTFWALLAIALLAAWRDELWAEFAGGVLLGAIYGVGQALEADHPHEGLVLGRVWLGLATACWIPVAVAAPQFVWPAFPLIFAYLRLLPLWLAMFGVTVLTSAAILAAVWHAGGVSLALVLGPGAGAAVVTSLALAYNALRALTPRPAG